MTPDDLTIQLRKHITPDPDTGCWVWGGKLDKDGYGLAWRPKKQVWLRAHRWAYESLIDEIPADHDLDHLCASTRACVNPEHLVPCTRQENSRRAHLRRHHGVMFDRDGNEIAPAATHDDRPDN